MNGDGKMDLNEFSVACKLINLKLKGMELPKSLPPQLLNSGQAAGAMGMGMGGMPPNSLPLQPGMGMPGELLSVPADYRTVQQSDLELQTHSWPPELVLCGGRAAAGCW